MDKLHRDIDPPIPRPLGEEADDIRVVGHCNDFRFAKEALEHSGACSVLWGKDLNKEGRITFRIAGEVEMTDAARFEQYLNLVGADLTRARCWGWRWRQCMQRLCRLL